jgi:lipoate synthase
MNDLALNTVCQEARCPNIFECWNAGTATFMVLGEICTRRCTFCAVGRGNPLLADADEPRRVAEAVETMGVRHAVITMVNRDDMPDGGAEHLARTVHAVRDRTGAAVEVLISDLEGNRDALRTIIASEVVFRAPLDAHLPVRIDPREHDDWGWFTLAEAMEKIRWTDDREALDRFRMLFSSDLVGTPR